MGAINLFTNVFPLPVEERGAGFVPTEMPFNCARLVRR